jgi:hypothetical protein
MRDMKKLYSLGENHFVKGVVYLLKIKKLYHLGENHVVKGVVYLLKIKNLIT